MVWFDDRLPPNIHQMSNVAHDSLPQNSSSHQEPDSLQHQKNDHNPRRPAHLADEGEQESSYQRPPWHHPMGWDATCHTRSISQILGGNYSDFEDDFPLAYHIINAPLSCFKMLPFGMV